MSPEQTKTACRVSTEFARFWRIFSHIKSATSEDVHWAEEFRKTSFENLRQIAELENDLEWLQIHELIYLGLFHTSYQLPVEFKYQDPHRN